MSNRPLISVLVPTYNYGRFTRECIESIWAQTWRPLELIVADDQSSDDSLAVAREMAPSSPVPMKVLALEHGGIVRTLNSALREASGEFIAILAADDKFRPTKLERQMEAMLRDPEVVLSHCNFAPIDAEGRSLLLARGGGRRPAEGRALADLLLGRATVVTGPLLRRTLVDAVGGFDTRYIIEDWPMYLKAASRGKIAFVEDALVERRVHGANWSARINPDRTLAEVFRDASVALLEELSSSREEFEEAASVHLSAQLRVALHAGQWGWALRMLPEFIRAFPSRRRFFLEQVGMGALSFGWHRAVKPLLPVPMAERAVSMVRRRQRS